MDSLEQGGDPTWDTSLGQDDATLNDLLSFYQTGQETPPPFVAEDAVPAPFATGAPEVPPGAPSVDAVDAEIEALIRSFQEPGASPVDQPEPYVAAAPSAPELSFSPPAPEPEVVYAPPPPPAPEPEVVYAPPLPPAPEPEVVYAPPPPPAPAAIAAPVVIEAQPVPPAPAQPAVAPVASVVPAATVNSAAAMFSASDLGFPALDLATPETRQAAAHEVGEVARNLASGVEGARTHLDGLYAQLAAAASGRAPVADIMAIGSALHEAKLQVGVQSPLYQQALMLKAVGEAYMKLLEEL